jgi:hypothetical protein
MEKYGVEESTDELRKSAADGVMHCPLCGKEVIDAESPTPRCPEHGSAPFEKNSRD